jgi:hypothetical protein
MSTVPSRSIGRLQLGVLHRRDRFALETAADPIERFADPDGHIVAVAHLPS